MWGLSGNESLRLEREALLENDEDDDDFDAL